jgi:hypothetical protein
MNLFQLANQATRPPGHPGQAEKRFNRTELNRDVRARRPVPDLAATMPEERDEITVRYRRVLRAALAGLD